jgi:hypothetical protein
MNPRVFWTDDSRANTDFTYNNPHTKAWRKRSQLENSNWTPGGWSLLEQGKRTRRRSPLASRNQSSARVRSLVQKTRAVGKWNWCSLLNERTWWWQQEYSAGEEELCAHEGFWRWQRGRGRPRLKRILVAAKIVVSRKRGTRPNSVR